MVTEPDHYPLPNIADVTTYLHGAEIFSKLDLLKGYYQGPHVSKRHPEDRHHHALRHLRFQLQVKLGFRPQSVPKGWQNSDLFEYRIYLPHYK